MADEDKVEVDRLPTMWGQDLVIYDDDSSEFEGDGEPEVETGDE